MPKRFLNVEYSGVRAEIDVTEAERLGQVLRAIKDELSNSLAQVDAPQLQLYDQQGQHINTWALLNSLPQQYFTELGLFLVPLIVAVPSSQEIQAPASHIVSTLASKLNDLNLRVVPKKASAFASSANALVLNAGMNGNFPIVNLPKLVRDAISSPVEEDDLEFARRIIDQGLFFSMFCKRIAESSNENRRSVNGTLSELFSQFFETDHSPSSNTLKFSLNDLNASFGLATPSSKPDFCHATKLSGSIYGLAVMEFKDTSQAPMEQIGQAYASATNIILSHLRLGLKWSECAVPIVLTNGNLYQFGWVTLLEHTFPVLHIATGVFDASVSVTRELIAKHLIHVKVFCSKIEEKLRRSLALSTLDSPTTITLTCTT